MNRIRSFVVSAGVAVAMLVMASTSHATTISAGTNNPLAFSWSYVTGTAAGTITGTGSLTVSGFNSNALTVAVTLNNTANQANERLTAWGFGIDPNASSVSFSDAADGGMIDASMDAIPSLATIEVCAWGGVNCSGGSNGGILGGASDTFSVILNGTWGSSVNIDPIGFKYQTDAGSFEFTSGGTPQGGSGGGQGADPVVPEPATLVLLGSGLALAAAKVRGRKASKI